MKNYGITLTRGNHVTSGRQIIVIIVIIYCLVLFGHLVFYFFGHLVVVISTDGHRNRMEYIIHYDF